ncbi:MAG: PEP-CTERM sorting domain-containing protein [Verrucomicrobia bacterium]|jgi:hypothetical protein|nr:PEP-CTERM sorting domain-containing protein [Verrucomicrobiota bacterium]
MHKINILLAGSLFSGASLFGAAGIFGAYTEIDVNGTSTLYGEAQPGPNTVANLGGADLGTINVGESITINTAEVLTFKNGGDNVTGATFHYRVFESSSTPGAFNEEGLDFGSDATFTDLAGNQFTNGGDQSWRGLTSGAQEIASSLIAGDYTLEAFWSSDNTDAGTSFVNDGGSNFSASFTVVPEPGSFALIAGALGMAFVAVRRRRS